jgi:hypothetical protein
MTTKTQWDGRLGVEVPGLMKGCCVESMLEWRPQTVGQKLACRYCNSTLKTIRAGETPHSLFTGDLGEYKRETEEPEMVIGGLYFSVRKFASVDAVKAWAKDREIGEPEQVENVGGHAYHVSIERLAPETIRAVWIAPGVIAEVGVSEKEGPSQGGQASMHSPGITTTSMASGGLALPDQGPVAVIAATPGMPDVLHGLTDPQDGHRHEFHLTPSPDPAGFRVQGLTSYNNGHAHMVEAALNPDGSLDSRTAPDQSPVGGHAHQHRVTFNPGMEPVAALKEAPEEVNLFRDQLTRAIERAKGKVAKEKSGV